MSFVVTQQESLATEAVFAATSEISAGAYAATEAANAIAMG
jgi:hypothetical protein